MPDVCDVAAQIPRSARGELEISDVNAHYLKQGRLTVEKLGRGYAWLDTGTPSSLLRAAQFVETVEDRQGLQIGSPEEVAWRKGYIDDAGLERLIEPIRESEYGKYLQRLLATRLTQAGRRACKGAAKTPYHRRLPAPTRPDRSAGVAQG